MKRQETFHNEDTKESKFLLIKKTAAAPSKTAVSTKSTRELKIHNPIEKNPLDKAMDAILATSTKVLDEDAKKLRLRFDPGVVTAMRLLMGDKTYSFVTSQAGTISSGTSVLAVNTAVDLSQTNEGSVLTALFQECRLSVGSFKLMNAITGGELSFAYLVGYEHAITTATPTAASVARLDYCDIWSLGSTQPRFNELRYKPRAGRLWGQTSDEGTAAADVIKGCDGTIRMYALTAPSSSITYFGYLVKQRVKFRSRT